MSFKDFIKNKWLKTVVNIYILVLTVFVVWMLFFDANSLLTQIELQKEINKLEKQKKHLQKEIEADKKLIKKLQNEQELEKYAREQYYLKKDNEEIYLIEYEDSLKNKKND